MASNKGDSGPANAAKSSAAEMANNAKELFDSSAKMVGILQMALKDLDPRMGEMLMQIATERMDLAHTSSDLFACNVPANAAKSGAAEIAKAKKKVEAASQLFDSSAKMVGVLQMALKDSDHRMKEMLKQAASETMRLAVQLLEEVKDERGNPRGMRAMSANATSTSFFTTGMQQNDNSGASCALSRNNKKKRPSDELDNDSYQNATTGSDGGRSKKNKIDTEKRLPFLFGSTIRPTPTSTATSFARGSKPVASSSSAAQPPASHAGTRKVSDEIDAGATWRATKQVLKTRKRVKVGSKKSAVKANVEDSGWITSTFASVKLAPSSAKETTKPDVKASVFASINLTPSATPENKTATMKSNGGGAEVKKEDLSSIATDEADTDNDEIQTAVDEEVLYEVDKARRKKRDGKEWETYETGKLRIYRHKQTLKHGMAIRNQIGQVQFNVAIPQGMKFLKEVKGKAAYVGFVAVEDASIGPETFLLQVSPEVVCEFHEKLEELANII